MFKRSISLILSCVFSMVLLTSCTTSEQPNPSPLLQTLTDSMYDLTLDSVNSVPRADDSDVGKAVELSLENKRFYYFYYPGDTAPVERIITIELVEGENYGKLVMYKPTLGGLAELCQCMDDPIPAKVVAVANITRTEAAAAFAGSDVQSQLLSEEIVKPDALIKNTNDQHWYFSINEGSAENPGKVIALAGNLSSTVSVGGRKQYGIIRSIIERFDLERSLFGERIPRGTLPDVASIPKADRSEVGETVSLFIGNKNFHYFYDAESGRERLLVLESVEFDESLGKITVYETKLGGLDGLIDAISKPIDAKILAVSNITLKEVNFTYIVKDDLNESMILGEFFAEGLIDLAEPIQHLDTIQWYCSVHSKESADVIALLSNLTDEPSEKRVLHMSRIDRIIYRYDLAKYL